MTVILVKLLGLDPLNVPAPISLLGFIMSVMLVTGLVWAVWNGLRLIGALAADMLEVQSTTQRIVIARGLTRHDYEQVRKGIRAWHLLLVRYGNDDYLRSMAGEADRQVGRPRYTIVPMRLALSPTGEVTLKWSLPVHRRLGTQFRCYIEIRPGGSGPAVLTGMLKHYDEIEVLDPEVESPTRAYFLLKRFRVVTTAEGVRQNFVSPE
ncbi:hypothetical protein [Limobrevibacterium gyesilva]|nr:hypothetical protein [Limobrevibacterium gyesilva]